MSTADLAGAADQLGRVARAALAYRDGVLIAVVLARGRLGGADRPGSSLGGRTPLDRCLDALAGAQDHTEPGPVVVVGPSRPTAHPVRWAREDPPGAGPAAALAAGLLALAHADDLHPPDTAEVALLGADPGGITPSTIVRLRAALCAPDGDADGDVDGAVSLDAAGRRRWLVGVWRLGPLHAALPAEPAGRSLRSVLAGLAVAEVLERRGESADVDTPDDHARARAGEGRRDGGPSQPSHW